MKLHYSQTRDMEKDLNIMFYYLMKLHYSQTTFPLTSTGYVFYYLMKLHYSQTFVARSNSEERFTTL